MLRLEGIKLNLDEKQAQLKVKAAARLRCPIEAITDLRILRRAIDAREGLQFVYTVAVAVKNENQVLRRCRDKRVTVYKPEQYHLPAPVACHTPPVVVGMGPGGLFAALVLAKCGLRPIVLERGADAGRRVSRSRNWCEGGRGTWCRVGRCVNCQCYMVSPWCAVACPMGMHCWCTRCL